MGLLKYNQKRNFKHTPEPSGTKKSSKETLIFTVQEHDATRLHYDFRLEIDGVLKSWAIPKGPSMNPTDKRLAIMVEDHPYNYKDFEGTIPKGNYGAGNVIVWDNGTYNEVMMGDKKESEKKLLNGLKKGHITFILNGKKLKGEFALIKLRGQQDNAWLLVKANDQYAIESDILKKERSVISNHKLKLKDRSVNDGHHAIKKVAKKAAKNIEIEVMSNKTKLKNNKKKGTDIDLKVGKVTLHLTNQQKIYFPKDKITKGDIVNYYKEVAPFMLPYLKGRPQSMNRFPNGINGPSFFQKDVNIEKAPDWLKTEKVFSESTNEYIDYLICNDTATLLYMANLGCIEINPWNSQIKSPENPDWAVIDLDPEDIPFTEVVKVALEVKKLMDEYGADCYCKTSGASGLHIYIPLAKKYDYDIVKTFAQLVAQTVNTRIPEITSILRSPKKRQKKVYLDFLQNRRGQTLAAPYSVRPKPGATVATPLEWKEVNNKLDPKKFTIKNTLKRLDKKGDLWKPVLGKGVNLLKILKKINKE